MKFLRTKWASLALIVAMLFSLLPPLTASAAATLRITNLYAPLGTADDPFKDELVNKFTVNPITVDFLYNGIPDDQISNIYYEIYNSNTGVNTVVTTNKPVKSTADNSQASFQNVQLYPGLNKITIKYGQGGSVASTPGYAYYTPVTNITNLQFNGDDFIDGGMYPKKAPYTGLTVTGTSLNATSIEANYQGTVFLPAAFTNGDFTFITNTGRTTDLEFNPGDNITTFAAKNVTNYYTATRSFVYDNGKAFAYNALIDLNGTTPSQRLVKNPVLKDTTSPSTAIIKDVALAADFKVPLDATNSTVTQYVYADVFTSGMASTKIRFDFANSSSPSITTSGTLNSGVAPSATISSPTTNPDYYVYHFTGNLPVNPNSSMQEVYFQFTDANGLVTTSKYSYSYVDPTQPYVDHVNINRQPAAGGTPYEVAISEAGSTQISEFPANLKVYTSSNAASVEIQLNGVKLNSGSASGRFLTSSGVASIDLQGIPDGPTVMKVIPFLDDTVGSTGYVAGTKQYNLIISGAPYAIINNIFNGIVVKSSNQISCSSSANGPCISGRVVNLPAADYSSIVYTLNDIVLTPSILPSTSNNGSFEINSAQFGTNFQKDGKYTFKIQLKVNGQPVTASSVDIFVLSDDVPTINYLRPIEADALYPQFITTSQPDTYVTRAITVQLRGETLNSALATSLTAPGTRLYLRKAPSTYTALTVGSEISLTSTLSSPPLQDFSSASVALSEYGEYAFELVSTNNSSGSTANKLVTITREPVPYAFVSPKQNLIIKNAKGIDQVSINQNFYMIELQADNADSVTFGKVPGIYNKATKTYFYEAKGLKVGANQIKFTVNRGTAKTNGSIVLFNTNTSIEGMQYKTPLASTMKIFNGDIQLKFPKDTKLMRNDRETQYVSADRYLLFGIANNNDGRVDKLNENQIGINYLATPAHFKTASKKIWIDGGVIKPTASDSTSALEDAFLGSGMLPNTTIAQQQSFYTRNYNDLVVPTQTGTLTMKYDPNIRADAAKYVSVFQFGYFNNPSGQGPALPGWKNIGGKVDPKNNTIEVPVDSFGYYQVMYMDDSFNDVTSHPWARDDLDTLYSKGIMSPKTPYQFMPNDPIGRGEFVTMMVKVFDIPLINLDTQQNSYNNNAATFLDVQKGYTDPLGLYDFLSIEAAARAGIVRGNSNGSFLPRSAITRQDAAIVIARAKELKLNPDAAKSLATLQKVFTDANSIEFYALPSVEAITKAGIIQGKDNVLLAGQKKTTQRFDPTENFTRAEAAAVAVRILKQLNKIPK